MRQAFRFKLIMATGFSIIHTFICLAFPEPLIRCESGFLNRMNAGELSVLWRDLRSAGAHALVVRGEPPAGWRVLGKSGYSVRMLD